MGITLIFATGLLFLAVGFIPGYGLLTIAGSILIGSALITNELSRK
jgi:hypothetical protein